MARFAGRQDTPGGRDPDSKWAHCLALSRRYNPGPTLNTNSLTSSSSSTSRALSNISDSKPLQSYSSATSYFALLSANEEHLIDGRSLANHKENGNHKQQGSVSGSTRRDMDSLWVAWFTERWHQHQLADAPDQMIQAKSSNSEQFFPQSPKTPSPSGIRQRPTQKNGHAQDPENAARSKTTSVRSVVADSVETITPWSSSPNDFLNPDTDSFDTFPELPPNFDSLMPFNPIIPPANEATGPCATAQLDDDEDFTWLGDQPAFPLNTDDESGPSSPSHKRNREEYPGGYSPVDVDVSVNVNAQTCQEERRTKKKQKTDHYHPCTHHHLRMPSPFCSSVLWPS